MVCKFPNAIAEAMNFKKGETVEWEVESLTVLKMSRKIVRQVQKTKLSPGRSVSANNKLGISL